MARPQPEAQASVLSKGYASLETQTRYISDKRIKKWPKSGSDDGVQARVHDILREVERTSLVQKKYRRPGRSSDKSDKGEDETLERQQGIDEAISLIEKRVPKIPFPPGTQELDFDFETLLDKNRALESQVIANNHSINLLRSEIEKEKSALTKDQAELESLENALKSTEMMRRKQAKQFHPLAKTMLIDDDPQMHYIAGDSAKPFPVIDTSTLLEDPEIGLLLEQLQNHLESMESNAGPVRGLVDAIFRAQASLDIHAATSLDQVHRSRLYDMDGV